MICSRIVPTKKQYFFCHVSVSNFVRVLNVAVVILNWHLYSLTFTQVYVLLSVITYQQCWQYYWPVVVHIRWAPLPSCFVVPLLQHLRIANCLEDVRGKLFVLFAAVMLCAQWYAQLRAHEQFLRMTYNLGLPFIVFLIFCLRPFCLR